MNSPNWNLSAPTSNLEKRKRDKGKLIIAVMRAVTLMLRSPRMKRRRIAPARGRNIATERIGKLSVFMIRYLWNAVVISLHPPQYKPQDQEKQKERKADVRLYLSHLESSHDRACPADGDGRTVNNAIDDVPVKTI